MFDVVRATRAASKAVQRVLVQQCLEKRAGMLRQERRQLQLTSHYLLVLRLAIPRLRSPAANTNVGRASAAQRL